MKDSEAISSEKIMQKLKEIKKTFADPHSDRQANIPAYLRSSEVESRQNERLRKYLPESIGRSNQHHNNIQDLDGIHHSRGGVTFRKTLEEKLQALFNQEKHLLRKRYEVNMVRQTVTKNTEEYERSVRQLERKYRRDDFEDDGIQNHGDQVRSMERKIQQLQAKYRENQQIQPFETYVVRQKPSKKQTRDNSEWRREMHELKEELTALKKANNNLKKKMHKREKSEEVKQTEQHLKLQITLLKEVQKLKKNIEQLKTEGTTAYPSASKQHVCEARVASRQRIKSHKQQQQKKYHESQVSELYSQIEELRFKLEQEQRSKMMLQEKNMWLEAQLTNFVQPDQAH